MTEGSRSANPALSFGQALRECRLAAGLTQAALAERAGLSERTIQDLERGIARPRRETARRLVAVLRLSAEALSRIEVATSAPRGSTNRQGRLPDLAAPKADEGLVHEGSVGAATHSDNRPRLPVPLTSFVGRETERSSLLDLLVTSRLLTLAGVGGVGKTRLAIEVARAAQSDFADGVWLVELASVATAELVPRAVGDALLIVEQPRQPPVETIIAALRTKRLLLVLDNCEHLVDGCARLVERLLGNCQDLRVLATSREPLGVPGEVTWRVPPLPVPPERSRAASRTALTDYGAVRLFVERARLVQPTFALTNVSEAAIAEICRQLDGIPLAIELAAARVNVLTVDQLAARLDDQLGLLTHGPRTAVARQRTLRATLDWSYALLTESEQTLLRRLAVFAGGWTLEAAEMVAVGNGIDRADVLDLLARLVDTSHVIATEWAGEVRYRLLEPVRQYGRDRQRAAGEEAVLSSLHAGWCLALAERADQLLRGPEQLAWFTRMDMERDNLRGALAWYLERDPPAGLRLVGALSWYWWVQSTYGEGRHWLESFLTQATDRTPSRARALLGLGALVRGQGDLHTARARLEESLDLYREVGDMRGEAWALRDIGHVLANVGAVDVGRSCLEEGLALVRAVGDRRGLAANLAWLADLELTAGETAHARVRIESSLVIAREVGDRWLILSALTILGAVARVQGEYSLAEACFLEAVDTARDMAAPAKVAAVTWQRAIVADWQGDLARAAALHECSLDLARRHGDGQTIMRALYGLGRVQYWRGDNESARCFFEESLTLTSAVDDSRRSLALHGLGLVALREGDDDQAAAALSESLRLRVKSGNRLGVAVSLEAQACIAARRGDASHTARSLGAAEALRRVIGAPLPPVDRPTVRALTQAAEAALGSEAFEQERTRGLAMSFEQAVAYALQEAALTPG